MWLINFAGLILLHDQLNLNVSFPSPQLTSDIMNILLEYLSGKKTSRKFYSSIYTTLGCPLFFWNCWKMLFHALLKLVKIQTRCLKVEWKAGPWFNMHPKHFDSDKFVHRYIRTCTQSCKLRLHFVFQAACARFGGKSCGHWDFKRREKQQQQSSLTFD